MIQKERIALITGGSSGIGLELAKLAHADGYKVVLVARNAKRLAAASKELPGSEVIQADLAQPDSPKLIAKKLRGRPVHLLVNNAGFGDRGAFFTADYERTQQMINTNVAALTLLTRLLLPDMIRQGSGRILNVASTAAFQPGPFMSVYYASKAYVLSFSEGLASELEGTGVTVTALCPGPTTTGFAKGAGSENTRLFRNAMPAAKVAAIGYKAMSHAKRTVVPGLRNKIAAFILGRLVPRKVAADFARRVQE